MSERIRFSKEQMIAAFNKGVAQITDPSFQFQWIFGASPPPMPGNSGMYAPMPTGPQGSPGLVGATGPTGPAGCSGNVGATGPTYPATTVTPPDPNAPGTIGQMWFTYCSPVGTDPVVPTAPNDIEYAEVKFKSKSEDGCHCKKCRNFSPYAEKNQPDGSFVCYSCTIVM